MTSKTISTWRNSLMQKNIKDKIILTSKEFQIFNMKNKCSKPSRCSANWKNLIPKVEILSLIMEEAYLESKFEKKWNTCFKPMESILTNTSTIVLLLISTIITITRSVEKISSILSMSLLRQPSKDSTVE
jgi:hypothetical protein